MESYDYRGYLIDYNPEGYYEIDRDDCVLEFPSYNEACDWIDEYIDSHPIVPVQPRPKLHAYHIFYGTANCGYDEYILAPTEDEAIKTIKNMHKDLIYITDIIQVEE